MERVYRMLDEVDGLLSGGDYENAFWKAQEALPADGSMDREEFDELQLLAWQKRENCSDRWRDQRAGRKSAA